MLDTHVRGASFVVVVPLLGDQHSQLGVLFSGVLEFISLAVYNKITYKKSLRTRDNYLYIVACKHNQEVPKYTNIPANLSLLASLFINDT